MLSSLLGVEGRVIGRHLSVRSQRRATERFNGGVMLGLILGREACRGSGATEASGSSSALFRLERSGARSLNQLMRSVSNFESGKAFAGCWCGVLLGSYFLES
jgi:hypothetical protein